MKVDMRRLEATLARDEGKNLERHLVKGVPHIGIGRNLHGRGLTDEEMEYLSVSDEDELQVIDNEQCSYLFQNDLQLAVEICYNIFETHFDSLSAVRQEVLLNLAFNLGEPRLRRFSNMIDSVNENDFEDAADEMLDSKAARKDAPARYKRLAKAMEFDDAVAFEVEYSDDSPDTEVVNQEGQALAYLESMENDIGELKDKVNKIDGNIGEILSLLNKKMPDKKKALSGLI